MNRVSVRKVFELFAQKAGRTYFHWTSTVEGDPHNCVFADMYIEGPSAFHLNSQATQIYGSSRLIKNIGDREWVDGIKVKRKLMGPVVEMSSLL